MGTFSTGIRYLVGLAMPILATTVLLFQLALLWLPFIGYPLVGMAWFLDVQARPGAEEDRPPPPPKRRRWSASVVGNTLEVVRRRGRLALNVVAPRFAVPPAPRYS